MDKKAIDRISERVLGRKLKTKSANNFMCELGIAIRELRRDANKTQKEVADKLGVKDMCISKVELGIHKDIGVMRLIRIARAIGLPNGAVGYLISELESLED